MGLLLMSFLAYVGVYAGVLLGSFAAEELPVGRYRLRMVQLILLVLMSAVLIYEIVALQVYVSVVMLIGIVLFELAFLLDKKVPAVFTHPKGRTLFIYGLLCFVLLLAAPQVQFLLAAIIFLYGLVTGSLIAEPFVHDRKLVPWDKPYMIALKWTWTYAFIWVILAFAFFS